MPWAHDSCGSACLASAAIGVVDGRYRSLCIAVVSTETERQKRKYIQQDTDPSRISYSFTVAGQANRYQENNMSIEPKKAN